MLTKKHKSVDNSEPALLSPSSAKRNWEVMRSIDPDHYRNIELEVWEESRKGDYCLSQFDFICGSTVHYLYVYILLSQKLIDILFSLCTCFNLIVSQILNIEQQQKDQAVAATIQFKKGERCQVHISFYNFTTQMLHKYKYKLY